MTSTAKKAPSKSSSSKPKTHQVMVTFGVRSETLRKQFHRLWKQSDQSEAGFARELIKVGIEHRLKK